MGLLLDVLGPVVLIVAAGALALPRLGLEARSLSSVAFWVLGPAFVFNLFADSTLSGGVVARLVISGLAGMLAAGLLAMAANRAVGSETSVASASVMTAAYGNVGNAGLAITSFALGETALAAAGVLMLTVNLTGISLGVALAARQSKSLLAAVGDGLRTPMTIAAVVAIGCNFIEVSPPLAMQRAIDLLAGAMIPTMLLGLGIQLAKTPIGAVGRDFAISAFAKLLIAPAVAAMTAMALGLAGDELGAVVLQSAMPPAVFCLAVALEHDLEPERVTTAVVGMTLLALLTLPVALILVT